MALFYHNIDIPSVVLFLLSGAGLVVSIGYGVLSLDVFPVLLWNAFENYCVSQVFAKVIAICLLSIAQLYC